MKVAVTFTGVDAAVRSMVSIPSKAKTGARRGISKANKLALAQMKLTLTRERTGLTRKSLGDKVKVSGSIVYGVIGPRLGFRTTIAELVQRSRSAKFIGFRGRKGQSAARAIKFRAARGLSIGDIVDPAKTASFIEFGHQRGRGKSSAQAYPFIGPARDRVADSVPGIVAAEINAAVTQGGV